MPPEFAGYQPSVLDRLADAASAGTPGRPGYDLRQMEEAVRRDLEDLLNTRRPPEHDRHGDPFFAGLTEVPSSIANYGVRDLACFDALTREQREAFAQHIADVIATFEPRLRDVTVTPRTPDEVPTARPADAKKTLLYFHIAARLALEPAPPVTFETVLELTDGHHQVLRGDV